eukprot:COSAG02_NODE_39349_length_418_cov_0.808777_1_plen_38_part_01
MCIMNRRAPEFIEHKKPNNHLRFSGLHTCTYTAYRARR